MGQAEKYKKIRKMVAALVLATAMTNGLQIKRYRGAPVAIAGKPYWHNEENVQDFRNNIPSNLDARSSTQIENERDRPNSDMRRPSITLIRRTDLTNKNRRFNLRTILTNPKCAGLKISVDLQSLYNCKRSSTQRCITNSCLRQIDERLPQEPLYVDEPRWIEIELDYSETLPHNFNTEDPFFLTRGKRIFKTIEAKNDDDRDGFLNDVTRSTRSREFSQEDSRFKRNGSKRKEERRKTLQLNSRQLEDLVKHFDPINDPFFLSRGKKLFEGDSIRELSLDDLKTEKMERKSHEETKRSVSIESKQSANNESIEVTKTVKNSSLMNNGNETSSELNEAQRVSSRTKRSTCTDFDCSNENSEKTSFVNDPEKLILDTSYVQRRNKHSDISDLFRNHNEPFFISRGKKASKNIDHEFRATPIDYNEPLSSLAAARRILQRLLDFRRCGTEDCIDLEKFVSQTDDGTMTDRDRRSALDDLLTKYDPFYVARGKRMRSDNSFEEDQLESRVSQCDESYSKDRVSYDFKNLGKR